MTVLHPEPPGPTPVPPPELMQLNANPTTITTSGGSSTITAVIAAGSHTISSVDLYTGSTKVGEMTLSSGDYVYTVTPSETTTYTVKINYGESETVSPSTSVTVTVNLTLPTLTSLTANPTTIIESGGSSTISAVVNAGSYTISKVDLYTGTTKVGEMTLSSGSYTYSVTPSDTTVYKVRIYYGEVNPVIPDDTVTVTYDPQYIINNVSYRRIGTLPADASTILSQGHNYFYVSDYFGALPIIELVDANTSSQGSYYYEMVNPSDYDPDLTEGSTYKFIGKLPSSYSDIIPHSDYAHLIYKTNPLNYFAMFNVVISIGATNSKLSKYLFAHRRKYGSSAGTVGSFALAASKNILYNIEGAATVYSERFSGTSLYVQSRSYYSNQVIGGYGEACLCGVILGSSWTEEQQTALYSAYADDAGWMFVTYYDSEQSTYATAVAFTTLDAVDSYLNGNNGILIQAPNYCNLVL